MGFGGALSFNGIDATLAAGAVAVGSIPAIPPISFPAASIASVSCLLPIPELSVTFSYSLPPIDIEFNVLVNGCRMTANVDGFGDLNIVGDLSLTKEECGPSEGEGFAVPTIASAQNILVNGIRAALPDIPPLTMPPIIDKAKMAMKTLQTNVMLYY